MFRDLGIPPFEKPEGIDGEEDKFILSQSAKDHVELVLADLGYRAKLLFGQLMPWLDAEVYGLVVSDEKSGHIASQLMHLAINRRYMLQGRSPDMRIAYVLGSRNVPITDMHQSLQSQLDGYSPSMEDKKVLLVTESMAVGDTVSKFDRVFSDAGMKYDVVTFMMEKEERHYRDKGKISRDARLFHLGVERTDLTLGANPVLVYQLGTLSRYSDPTFGVTDYDIAMNSYIQQRLPQIAAEVI